MKKVNRNEVQSRGREARGPQSEGREEGTYERGTGPELTRCVGSEGKSRRATKTCGLKDTQPDKGHRCIG